MDEHHGLVFRSQMQYRKYDGEKMDQITRPLPTHESTETSVANESIKGAGKEECIPVKTADSNSGEGSTIRTKTTVMMKIRKPYR